MAQEMQRLSDQSNAATMQTAQLRSQQALVGRLSELESPAKRSKKAASAAIHEAGEETKRWLGDSRTSSIESEQLTRTYEGATDSSQYVLKELRKVTNEVELLEQEELELRAEQHQKERAMAEAKKEMKKAKPDDNSAQNVKKLTRSFAVKEKEYKIATAKLEHCRTKVAAIKELEIKYKEATKEMRAQANEQSSSERHSEQDVPRADAHDPLTLFMGNLAFDVDVEEIRRIFEKYGRITSIHVPKDG
jgi:myosin heavy subunit